MESKCETIIWWPRLSLTLLQKITKFGCVKYEQIPDENERKYIMQNNLSVKIEAVGAIGKLRFGTEAYRPDPRTFDSFLQYFEWTKTIDGVTSIKVTITQ